MAGLLRHWLEEFTTNLPHHSSFFQLTENFLKQPRGCKMLGMSLITTNTTSTATTSYGTVDSLEY
jgi:hypothetical protein